MSTQTSNLQLIKPDRDDYYDIQVQNNNMDKIDESVHSLSTNVEEIKKSVSDGKTLVANAITGKGISTSKDATFQTMATNISAIETNPTLQAKTVTLSTSAQTVKADSGYDGLSQVTVPAVGGNAVAGDVLSGKTFASGSGVSQSGTMVNNGAVSQTLKAGGSYTIPSGYHNGLGKITADTLANQTSGTAIAENILSGATAWVNGQKITGSMKNYAGEFAIPVGMTMGSNLDVVVAKGYYNGVNAHVALQLPTLASALGITADKIASGNTVCGVVGNVTPLKYATGDMTNLFTQASGAFYTGSSTGTAVYKATVTGLPFTPKLVKIVYKYGGPERIMYGTIGEGSPQITWVDINSVITCMVGWGTPSALSNLISENSFIVLSPQYIINSVIWEAWG